MKEKTVCFECGVVLTEGNSYTLDGNTMCEECFERLTTNCDNCSTRIWRDNAEGDSNYIDVFPFLQTIDRTMKCLLK